MTSNFNFILLRFQLSSTSTFITSGFFQHNFINFNCLHHFFNFKILILYFTLKFNLIFSLPPDLFILKCINFNYIHCQIFSAWEFLIFRFQFHTSTSHFNLKFTLLISSISDFNLNFLNFKFRLNSSTNVTLKFHISLAFFKFQLQFLLLF